MAVDKQTKRLARQLFRLSLAEGTVSPERVAGVLGWIEKHQPRHTLAVLRSYHRYVASEIARSRAVVEHAGPIADSTLRMIEGAMSQKYRRPITATAKPSPGLIAGLRVRVDSDVFEASVAGQLASLSNSL